MYSATQLLKKFSTIKTLPHIAIHLIKMITDETKTLQELEEVIKLDPTLVLRILRLVNSAYFSLQHKVNTVADALVFVGMNNLRNMVVVEALKDVFRVDQQEVIFSRKQLWLHCAAVSICCQMISERVFGQNGEDAFLCGILHDIGLIVEDQVVPELFIDTLAKYKLESGTLRLNHFERQIIGTDHCEIGSSVAKEWSLPLVVQEGIESHHKELESVKPSSIQGVIQLGEYLATKLDYAAFPGMNGMLSNPLRLHVKENLKEYKALIRDMPEEMDRAKEIYEIEV